MPPGDRLTDEYLPRSVARPIIVAETVVGLVALLIFIVTALLVARHLTQSADTAVLAAVLTLNTPLGMRFAGALAVLGQNGITVGAIFLGIVFLARRRWTELAVTIAIVAGAEGLDLLFKAIFARPRPTELPSLIAAQAYSFPSGHAVSTAAFFLFLAYLGWQILRVWQRIVWTVVCLGLMLAVAFSRVYLGVHYPSDVVAGAALGIFWADAVVLGQQLITRRQMEIESPGVGIRR